MPLPPKADFLRSRNLPEDAVEIAGLDWADLEHIHTEHSVRVTELTTVAAMLAEQLRRAPSVHSVRWRVKDPINLVAKIIRKSEEKGLPITSANYTAHVTDRIGLRALHLFKNDWTAIHDFICATWARHEKPTANYREGDPANTLKLFEDRGCTLRKHPDGYRSVHYLVRTSPTMTELLAEVQVRTVFEEGWSEIDHRLRYPHNRGDHLLSHLLVLFNRIAGSADEMGTFINVFAQNLEETKAAQQAQEDTLRAMVHRLGLETSVREQLEKQVAALKAAGLVGIGAAFLGALAASGLSAHSVSTASSASGPRSASVARSASGGKSHGAVHGSKPPDPKNEG